MLKDIDPDDAPVHK
jgi:hypothetical protein